MAREMSEMPPEQSRHYNYEHRDASPRLIAWFAFSLALFLGATMAGLWFIRPLLERKEVNVNVPVIPPEPRLQAKPVLDHEQLMREQELILNSYRWIDRENGIVAIPINHAMQMIAEKGLPVQEQEPGQ